MTVYMAGKGTGSRVQVPGSDNWKARHEATLTSWQGASGEVDERVRWKRLRAHGGWMENGKFGEFLGNL